MPRITVDLARSEDDVRAALEVWSAANAARRKPPGAVRTERVAAKLAEAEVLLLARYGDRPAGMALAETYVDGDPDPACGHVSMVFVDPARWGSGIGTRLVRALQSRPAGREWDRLSVWTRLDNKRGRRLYSGTGFVDTGDRATLQDGDVIVRLSWRR